MHWHRLPKAGDAPSLEMFKNRFDGALGSLIWLVATLSVAGVWDQMIFKFPSNVSYSMIL